MKPLYLTTPVRQGLGACLRPGGEALTRRAIELLQPKAGSILVDAGCGAGGGMRILATEGRKVFGLDLDFGLLSESQKENTGPLVQADLARLPLADGSVDAIFCECAWNLTKKNEVLSEFYRVVRPGGALVLSDIYLRCSGGTLVANGWPIRSCFSYATDLATVENMVRAIGFEQVVVEDHIHLFKQTAAEFVFAHGSLHEFWKAVVGDEQLAKRACAAATLTRPSLFLLIAKRSNE
ncbi:MAG: SAM-dependent methyltransferase [Desulfotalea sp.]|nr:MAG: SAM-dependent methyltransferase [Desulfotalea sp.]